MGIISSRFYGEPSKELTVIGITGTKGKTTTSYMIKDMLELAEDSGITIVKSKFSIFKISGILYGAGIEPLY